MCSKLLKKTLALVTLVFKKMILVLENLIPKEVLRMTNMVDSDETALSSRPLGLHCFLR